jgi:hypothetical protein
LVAVGSPVFTATNTAFQQSLAARKSASRTDASATTAGALSRALGRTITTDSLVVLNLPFTTVNERFGRPVTLAVLRSERIAATSLGSAPDSVRVTVPADQWVPGQRLYFVETFGAVAYDTVSTTPSVVQRVRMTGGVPDTVTVTRVTWGPTTLGCASPAAPVSPAGTCNPVSGRGGTGHTLVSANEALNVVYWAPIVGLTSLPFTITPEVTGERIAAVGDDALKGIRVVPNPYLMFSEYEQTRGLKRLLFTNLPPRGMIRIFTASGQFVQQITWTEPDLDRNCRATTSTTACTATGDLQWNMRTREDLEIGPGFYVFVVSSEVGGRKAERLGKFVVIH